MLIQFIYVFVVVALMLAMLGLFVFKAGLQLKYLRIQDKKPEGSLSDILQFDYSSSTERQSRMQAFLLFPLLYPIDLEEGEAEALKNLKLKIKKIHIGIYSLLILVIILAVYSEKVFPQSV